MKKFHDIDDIDFKRHTKYAYLAHSTDEDVRKGSTSGGFTKSFIHWCTETETFDDAVITRMNGIRAETIITHDPDDILDTNTNSVYQYHNSVTKLKDTDPDKKYIYTTLPCYLPIVLNKHPNVMPITLLCKQNPQKEFTDFIIRKVGLEPEQVKQFHTREGSHDYDIEMHTGEIRKISFIDTWKLGEDYLNKKCQTCVFTPFRSPISVADPWNLMPGDPFQRKSLMHKTLVMVEDVRANDLIKRAAEDGYITIEQLPISKVVESQDYHLDFKRKNVQIKSKKSIFTYVWNIEEKGLNFGELIPERILQYHGYEIDYYTHQKARTYKDCHFMIGSELHKDFVAAFPTNLKIWGTGYAHSLPFDIKDYKFKVDVRMVRGPITKHALNLPRDTSIGDPGIVLPVLRNPVEKKHGKVLYIPHWENRHAIGEKKNHWKFDEFVNIILDDNDPKAFDQFVDKLTGASMVLTNSLHVAMACFAYNVPFSIALSHGDKLNFPIKWQDAFMDHGISIKPIINIDEGHEWYAEQMKVAIGNDIITQRRLLESWTP